MSEGVSTLAVVRSESRDYNLNRIVSSWPRPGAGDDAHIIQLPTLHVVREPDSYRDQQPRRQSPDHQRGPAVNELQYWKSQSQQW